MEHIESIAILVLMPYDWLTCEWYAGLKTTSISVLIIAKTMLIEGPTREKK